MLLAIDVGGGALSTLPLALYALPPVIFFVVVQRHISRAVLTTSGIRG